MDVCCSVDLGQEFIYQDVDLSGGGDAITDLVIPSGKVVVGSGHYVTKVWNFSSNVRVASESVSQSTASGQMAYVNSNNGPHPSDSTKWRFYTQDYVGGQNGDPVTVRVWIIVTNG